MTERPILFTGPMVRAILAGKKTQTRRIVKGVEECPHGYDVVRRVTAQEDYHLFDLASGEARIRCPYGKAGDRLWVRENGWERPERTPKMMREGADTWKRYYYDADGETGEDLKAWGFKRRPSIHMPRWACRLVLEVTGVRVQRLQDIAERDMKAEGVDHVRLTVGGTIVYNAAGVSADTRPIAWRNLWNSINAKRGASWAANPWVWVVDFARVQ